MNVLVNIKPVQTIQQVADSLQSHPDLELVAIPQAERYRWISSTLQQFHYPGLSKAHKGLLLAYLRKLSGYSRTQLTRLVRRLLDHGVLSWDVHPVRGFHTHYTPEDIQRLAEMDALHDTPSGPAMKKLCERAWHRFGDPRCERLAEISVSHLYNLRRRPAYQKIRLHRTKTRPTITPIGIRRSPDPQGRPGFLRIDTVHQGDWDGVKGLYHINVVDEVTQMEVVVAVEGISERFLIPALKTLLTAFPFVLLGFHADNGSEYINRQVARLLEKLRIEFTKSRPRHCNDNALVESKNASVVRKFIGHGHIPQRFADLVNRFHRDHLVPYINYHRPCYFPETFIDAKGRQRKRYRYEHMMTPYEKLKSLPDAQQFLNPGVFFQRLDDIAYQISDNEAAQRLQTARQQLFETIQERMRTA